MYFKTLRTCRHNSRKLAAGETIESHTDLARAFPERFAAAPAPGADRPAVSTPQLQELAGTARAALKAVPRGRGKYDVINTVTGKALNEAALTKAEAERIVMESVPDEEDDATSPGQD